MWRDRASIVSAVAVWFSNDRICVEWRTTSEHGIAVMQQPSWP